MDSDAKPLPHPLRLGINGGTQRDVESVEGALALLTSAWPESARGPRHRDAVETCLKVIDGHRSAADAESALRLAAEEAGFEVQPG